MPEAADWPDRLADLIDDVVGLVRDRAVRPLMLLARIVVFAAVLFALGATATALIAIGLVRLLNAEAFDGRVWAAEALVGAVLVALGAGAWHLRAPRSRDEDRR
jgi:hypothetical protein